MQRLFKVKEKLSVYIPTHFILFNDIFSALV